MDFNARISRRSFLAASAAAGTIGLPALASAATSKPAVGGKKGWQIGCYTRPWADHEYPIALDAIAEAGFKYVGLMTTKSAAHFVITVDTTLDEAHHIGEECRKRKLDVLSIYGGDFPIKEGVKAAVAGLRKLIDNCAAVGSPSLLLGGTGNKDLYETYYKAVAECCDYAADKKLALTIKPHGGMNSTGPECRKCIEGVNNRNFRLWYDAGNIFYYSDGKLDPVDDAPTVNGIVTGMCIKDYVDPKKVDVTPGTGRVRFAQVLEKLKQGGFSSGPLVIELVAPQPTPAALIAEAGKARRFVETLVAGA